MASSVTVTVFILASILFFTIGFLCGHFRICQKRRKPSAAAAGETQSVPSGVAACGQSQIPYYDDVVLQQEVELKENVAYGPLR